MKWRLIINAEPRTATENMALDYALMRSCSVPTLRLYSWNPPAVSIGRFQSLKDEIDLDYCKSKGIDFVRRITGGGAVFHDKELTYSICIRENNPFFSSDLHESYKAICNGIIVGLSKIGLSANYAPINDILVNGKKISGCAQTRKNGVILQHGTLLMEVDVEKMFSFLQVPNEKIKDKMISDVRKRVTSISSELRRKVSKDELIDNIIKGFEEYFKIKFEKSEVSSEEIKLMKKIKKDVFENEGWLYER